MRNSKLQWRGVGAEVIRGRSLTWDLGAVKRISGQHLLQRTPRFESTTNFSPLVVSVEVEVEEEKENMKMDMKHGQHHIFPSVRRVVAGIKVLNRQPSGCVAAH